jgi:hypothetical protein
MVYSAGFSQPAIFIDCCCTLKVRSTRSASSTNVVTMRTLATACQGRDEGA